MYNVIFSNDPVIDNTEETMAVTMPSGIVTAEQIFHFFADSLKFPDYFGHNWDALDECIRDLTWLKKKTIAIVHSGLPFEENRADFFLYIDILASASRGWSMDEEHDLLLCFKKEHESIVKEALSANVANSLLSISTSPIG